MENGESGHHVPYVVSEDIYILLERWARQRGFTIPDLSFFTELRQELNRALLEIFPIVDFVSEKELCDGLETIVNETGLPVISLDKIYCKSDLHIHMTRLVNQEGERVGVGVNNGFPPLDRQYRRLKKRRLKKVALADDVIFSGQVILNVIAELHKIGIEVSVICAGIGVGGALTLLEDMGRTVHCVRSYGTVIDEVCERDFWPGVPLCGRSVATTEYNYGIPYILPFAPNGKMTDWATIPEEHHYPFSRRCLELTILLFEEIEKLSDRNVLCQDLERKVLGLPIASERFVDSLKAL